ncbi:hypothetical protein BOTBODRAFT_27608 [Botryobasidium botryosum FD-172 SS1]|uniref:Phosphatidylglycerol/phosphatidylinositol transfer protein n=1 Tax=Botryobasidium botryosum (strain FD-172 SS1) TaxID=930990 RepID=A0A067N8T3_BOTB1|nr:hypothetical protein BOTBODRAFT_27608 [Botryobasidium botryosum FD-172 SS1]
MYTSAFTLLALLATPFVAASPVTPRVPASSISYTNCGNANDVLQIQSLTFNPTNPTAGQNLTVNFSGTLGSTIDTGSSGNVTVSFSSIQVVNQAFDLCNELKSDASAPQCPLQQGSRNFSQTVALPANIPAADYKIGVTANTQTGSPLLCVNIDLNLSS